MAVKTRLGPSISAKCFLASPNDDASYGSKQGKDLIDTLKSLKQNVVEITYPRICEPRLVKDVWNILVSAGLEVTIHARQLAHANYRSFEECWPPLAELPPDASTVIAFHPLDLEHSGDQRELGIARNNKLLRQLSEILVREKRNHRIAVEIQRQVPSKVLGVNYSEILQMIQGIDKPAIGICWDFGHSYYNVIHDNLSLNPPAEFLQRTIHVHIHSLYQDRTHFSLSRGDVPLELWVNLLCKAGYSGCYIFELYYSRMAGILSGSEQMFDELAKSYDTLMNLNRNDTE